tara:strand:- start:163 stop:453 length:291 start_codon:yes stop_codon:yes gene_type:complete
LNKVFVYGILVGQYRGEDASLYGYKKITGIGGYADIIKDKNGRVDGELLRVNDGILDYFDMVESNGSFYERHIVKVETPRGFVENVWVYQQMRNLI